MIFKQSHQKTKLDMLLLTHNNLENTKECKFSNLDNVCKILTLREVSNMVMFLLSDSAKYIIGENYFIDGGSFI